MTNRKNLNKKKITDDHWGLWDNSNYLLSYIEKLKKKDGNNYLANHNNVPAFGIELKNINK